MTHIINMEDLPPRHRKRWTPQEDHQLLNYLYTSNVSIDTIANCLQRTSRSIALRLTHAAFIARYDASIAALGYPSIPTLVSQKYGQDFMSCDITTAYDRIPSYTPLYAHISSHNLQGAIDSGSTSTDNNNEHPFDHIARRTMRQKQYTPDEWNALKQLSQELAKRNV